MILKNGSSGSELMKWTDEVTAYANSGGRLPTIEELRALRDAHAAIPYNNAECRVIGL